jgi:hypothetical protein
MCVCVCVCVCMCLRMYVYVSVMGGFLISSVPSPVLCSDLVQYFSRCALP